MDYVTRDVDVAKRLWSGLDYLDLPGVYSAA